MIKNSTIKRILLATTAAIAAQFLSAAPQTTQSAHISFFSSTPAEDISSNNYSVTSMIDLEAGKLAFSVPMQSFEFPKALMQKHFNQRDFLDTKAFPKATFSGTITDAAQRDFTQAGTYEVTVSGTLEIKGVKKEIEQSGTIVVSDSGVEANSKFDLTLADFGIEFKGGKPAKNIAKTIAVTIHSKY